MEQNHVGVAQETASYAECRKVIGMQDDDGNTIGIAYVDSAALRLLPLIVRGVLLIVVLIIAIVGRPFGWLPSDPSVPVFIQDLATWEPVSAIARIIGFITFALYVVSTVGTSGIYVGLPGAEIHFTLYKKIVKTLREGEWTIIWDPRVKPFALASTKPLVLTPDEVTGITKDNISLHHSGAYLVKAVNTYRLLEKGGYTNFLQQLAKQQSGYMKDQMQQVMATSFHRFMIEPVVEQASNKLTSITTKLAQLEASSLSVEFLQELSAIEEVNVSEFKLSEAAEPQRKIVVARVRALAEDYGLEITDYIPQGNLTSDDFLRTLATPLVSSIARLRQATETFETMTKEFIEQEVQTATQNKKMGELKIRNIIQQILSIKGALSLDKNRDDIVKARIASMKNIVDAAVAEVEAKIESLSTKVRGQSVNVAGLERYFEVINGVYSELEQKLTEFAPQVGTVIVSRIDSQTVIPEFNLLEAFMDKTGTREALEKLRGDTEKVQAAGDLEKIVTEINEAAGKIEIDGSMSSIKKALDQINPDCGVDTEAYSPEKVTGLVDAIVAGNTTDGGKGDTVVGENETTGKERLVQ